MQRTSHAAKNAYLRQLSRNSLHKIYLNYNFHKNIIFIYLLTILVLSLSYSGDREKINRFSSHTTICNGSSEKDGNSAAFRLLYICPRSVQTWTILKGMISLDEIDVIFCLLSLSLPLSLSFQNLKRTLAMNTMMKFMTNE